MVSQGIKISISSLPEVEQQIGRARAVPLAAVVRAVGYRTVVEIVPPTAADILAVRRIVPEIYPSRVVDHPDELVSRVSDGLMFRFAYERGQIELSREIYLCVNLLFAPLAV